MRLARPRLPVGQHGAIVAGKRAGHDVAHAGLGGKEGSWLGGWAGGPGVGNAPANDRVSCTFAPLTHLIHVLLGGVAVEHGVKSELMGGCGRWGVWAGGAKINVELSLTSDSFSPHSRSPG